MDTTDTVEQKLDRPVLAVDLNLEDWLGQMKAVPGRATLVASTTYHGHRTDQVRSALQKAVRRSDAEGALYWATELYLFRLLEDDPKQGAAARKLVSNCLNRLLVITVEDVGLAQPLFPLEALQWYQTAKEGGLVCRYPGNPSQELREGKGFRALVAWVDALVAAPKARTLSDLGLYWKPSKAEWALQQPALAKRHFRRINYSTPKLLESVRTKEGGLLMREPFEDFLTAVCKRLKGWHFFSNSCIRLLALIELRDPLAFYWCARDFVFATSKLKPPLMRRTKPVYLVWEMLKLYARERIGYDSNQPYKQIFALQQIYEMRSSCREASLFLYQALLYCVLSDKIPSDPAHLHRTLGFLLEGQLFRHLHRDQALEVPDHALDKHTKRGRELGKTSADFARQGALIPTNECKALVDPALRQLYNTMYERITGHVELVKHPWTGQGPVKGWPQYRPLDADDADDEQPTKKRCKTEEGEEEASPPTVILSESEAFEWPQRVQVLTSKSKPDVFFCLDKSTHRALWVKGPYLKDGTDSSLQFQMRYNRCKYLFRGIHPVPDMEIRYLRPEPEFLGGVANPEGFGTRTKIEPRRAYAYLVARDVQSPDRRTPYQVKAYGKDGGCWPSETELADPQASGSRCVHLNSAKADQLKDIMQIKVLLVLLLRLIWDVNDTCDRNILLDLENDRVFGVDAEGIRSRGMLWIKGPLYKRPLGKSARAAMTRVIERHWETVQREYLVLWIMAIPTAGVYQVPDYVRRNLVSVFGFTKRVLIELL